MTHIITPSQPDAVLVAGEVWDNIVTHVAAVSPEDVDGAGVIGRNAATGLLAPDAQRTTAWAEPAAAVEGWAVRLPAGGEGRGAPSPVITTAGAQELETPTLWPSRGRAATPPAPAAWFQPLGAHDCYPLGVSVTYGGQVWISTTPANVFEPGVFGWKVASTDPPAGGPQPWVQPIPGLIPPYAAMAQVTHAGKTWRSLIGVNVWSPSSYGWEEVAEVPAGPLPWVQPTHAGNSYAVGAEVTHTVAGRTTTIWRSKIAANTTEPGHDGTYDRWWGPVN